MSRATIWFQKLICPATQVHEAIFTSPEIKWRATLKWWSGSLFLKLWWHLHSTESFATVATTSSQNFALQFYAEKTTYLRGKHLEYLLLWASQHHQILQMRPYFNEFSLRRKDWLAPFSCNSSMLSAISGIGVWRHEIYYLRPFIYWLYRDVDLEPQQLMSFFIWNNTRNLSQKLVIPQASTKQRLEFRPWWDFLICFLSDELCPSDVLCHWMCSYITMGILRRILWHRKQQRCSCIIICYKPYLGWIFKDLPSRSLRVLKLDSGRAILKPNLYQNHNAWLRNSCVPVYREKRISILILYDPLVLHPFVEIDI